MIVGMNHFTVIAEDQQKTLDFYVGLLGLKDGYRPDLGFPGAWLYGERPAGGAAPVLRPPGADAARRRDRPHGVHGAATCRR